MTSARYGDSAEYKVQRLRNDLLESLDRLTWDLPEKDVVSQIKFWFGDDFVREFYEFRAEDNLRPGIAIVVSLR